MINYIESECQDPVKTNIFKDKTDLGPILENMSRILIKGEIMVYVNPNKMRKCPFLGMCRDTVIQLRPTGRIYLSTFTRN